MLHGCIERYNQSDSDGYKQRNGDCCAVNDQDSGASGDFAVERAYLPTCILGYRYSASRWVFKAVYASPFPGVADLADVPGLVGHVYQCSCHCCCTLSRLTKPAPMSTLCRP